MVSADDIWLRMHCMIPWPFGERLPVRVRRCEDLEREQFTVRAPKELVSLVREEAAAYGDSINDLVVSAVQKEVSARRQLRLLDQIEKEREVMAARGLQPDSTPLVRQIRMGSDRHK